MRRRPAKGSICQRTRYHAATSLAICRGPKLKILLLRWLISSDPAPSFQPALVNSAWTPLAELELITVDCANAFLIQTYLYFFMLRERTSCPCFPPIQFATANVPVESLHDIRRTCRTRFSDFFVIKSSFNYVCLKHLDMGVYQIDLPYNLCDCRKNLGRPTYCT